MSWIRRRAWYLASIALGIVAIGIDGAGKQAISRAVSGIARASEAKHMGVADVGVQALKAGSAEELHRAGALFRVGLLIAALAVACLIVAGVKGERGRRSVPIVILGAYVLLLFLAV